MYKILVVDDEPRQRRALVSLIRELDDQYDVSEAKNGKEAFEFAEADPFDIIVTDIKMPIMDGMELIQELHRIAAKTRIILLSGYAYFEYAQKAIALGASDYILKPIEVEKVAAALRKAQRSIEEEKTAETERKTLLKQLNETLPVYFEHLMNKWLTGQMHDTELAEVEKVFPFKGMGTVLATEIRSGSNAVRSFGMEETGEIKTNLKYWIKTVLESTGHVISFFLEDRRCIMVSIINSSTGFDLLAPECMSDLKGYMESMNREYGFHITMGIGLMNSDIFNGAGACFEQAMEALSARFYHAGESIFHYSRIVRKPGLRKELAKLAKEEALTENIRFVNAQGIVDTAEDFFNRILSGGYYKPEYVIEFVKRLILNILETLADVIDPRDLEQLHYRAENLAGNCTSFLQLKKLAVDFFLDTAEAIRTNKTKSGKEIMKECMQYLEQHYMDNISLEDIAEVFHFNPNYFSGVFKTHSGISFSEYLCRIRMRHARHLLETSSLKIYEVAERVGYRDSRYFDRVFKKEFHLSPEQYRKRFSHSSDTEGFRK